MKYLSDYRYEEIKRKVVEVFEKYNVSCVPVNGFEIATKMGIKVIPYSSLRSDLKEKILKLSEDGCTIKVPNAKSRIYYNDENRCYGRINNTFLHEIGHIVLGHTEDSELAEKEVNFFAKYALAPPVLIYKLKLETPEQIADTFNISHQASNYAYNYYKKWLFYGGKYFKDYEMKILDLFQEIA